MLNEVTSNIKEFILGGKADFTIFQEPNIEFKYYVRRNDNGSVWFIYVGKEYQGYIHKSDLYTVKFGNKRPEQVNEKALKGLIWVLKHADNLPSAVHVYHHGKCSVCGRKLKDAESLMYGIGPTCRGNIGW